MSHQTYYRRYRSQTFSEVLGQQHIVQTLQNAIRLDRLSHAYIFSGPRGTGKTSTARILAKTLNCRNPQNHEPCLTCDICKKIAQAQAVDIIEMDAASNTGVDHIRVLNDQVHFAPVECPYRMFIIDEAHMLSSGAFNALLKTLEEPPANTIFILATTEPHKIPITIHSRCQHLQFKKITTEILVSHLKNVSEQEQIQISEPSLHTIARNASGCMRDALSLLEQIVAFQGDVIEHDAVISILGSASFDAIYQTFAAFFSQDNASTMQQLQQLYDNGANPQQLINEMTQFLKQLLFVKLSLGNSLDLDQARQSKLSDLASNVEFNHVQTTLESFAKTEMDMRWFPNPELLLQIRFLAALQTPVVSRENSPAPATASAPAPQPISAKPEAARPAPEPQQKTAPKPSEPIRPAAAPAAAPSKAAPINTDNGAQSGEKTWEGFLAYLQETAKPYFALIRYSSLLQKDGSQLTILLQHDNKFARDKLTDSKGTAIIESALKGYYGEPLHYSIKTQSELNDVPVGNQETASAPEQAAPVTASPASSSSEKLNTIVAMFEGQIVS